DRALSLRTAGVPRVANRERARRAGHHEPRAHRRGDGLPGHPRPPRAPRARLPRAVRAPVADGPRGHRGGLPRTGRRAARGDPARLVGRATQGAGPAPHAAARIERRPPIVYDEATRRPESRGRRDQGMSDDHTLQVGEAAPDFTLKTIGLKEVSLRSYR